MKHARAAVAFAVGCIAVGSSSEVRAEQPTPAAPPALPPTPSHAPPPAPGEAPPSSSTSSSMKLTYEATQVDRASAPKKKGTALDDAALLHGFRLGYGFVMNYDAPASAFDGRSLKEQANLRSPHHFLLGYEVVYRVVGRSWLNVLLIGNGMIAGLEQSRILPSANLLIGFELKNSFQIGIGANVSPIKGSEAHTIVAAGWTPQVGTIYTPVHVFFIPDVDGVHRMGITTGVTF